MSRMTLLFHIILKHIEYMHILSLCVFFYTTEPIDEDEAQKKGLLKEREAMGDHVTSRV